MTIDLPARVVLASASPQRRRLLGRLVAEFETSEPRVEETTPEGMDAEEVAEELARRKAREVASRRSEAVVIAADTIVECRGEMIGKPRDRRDAVRIITLLTRNPHAVVTGLCVIAPDGSEQTAVEQTRIRMRRLSPAEIHRYVEEEDVMERAGAYGLKELDPNVLSLEGSRSSVMGLPLEKLEEMLGAVWAGGAPGVSRGNKRAER